jgi:hypothetical protein
VNARRDAFFSQGIPNGVESIDVDFLCMSGKFGSGICNLCEIERRTADIRWGGERPIAGITFGISGSHKAVFPL